MITSLVVAEPVIGVPGNSSEGPFWDARDQSLNWIEIDAGQLHSWRPVTGWFRSIPIGAPLGAAAPRRLPGFIAGVGLEVVVVGPDGTHARPAALIETETGLRINDGRCDPTGSFWLGTMSLNLEPRRGRLLRIDPSGGVTSVLEHVGLSNGLDWSPDGLTLYFVDSLAEGVDALESDTAYGLPQRRRRFVDIDNSRSTRMGVTLPDGLTVDADGFVWVAIFGAGRVWRYSPDGRLVGTIEVPVPAATSCCFGGADLGDLYITTGGGGVDQAHLFRCRPGARGHPGAYFEG